MIDLEKNRVYDTGEIETLKSTAVSLLDTGIEACLSWDDAITQLLNMAKTKLAETTCGMKTPLSEW